MKLQKNYGCGVHHKIGGYQLYTFLENKILRQTIFLESSVRLLSGTCQKDLSYQTGWKEHCAENNMLYDGPIVEQFLNFFT